ncbi:MAG: Octanoate-[acyl-carrier-protein]-protein-N-octanoyltransferase, partial [uncultured Gemmatimonadaceae bacterium]
DQPQPPRRRPRRHAVRGGARRPARGRAGADRGNRRRRRAAARRAPAGGDAGARDEGAPPGRVSRPAGSARRRGARGGARRRRDVPRARSARGLPDRRPQAPPARPALVPAAGGGGADPRARRGGARGHAEPRAHRRLGGGRRTAGTRSLGARPRAGPAQARLDRRPRPRLGDLARLRAQRHHRPRVLRPHRAMRHRRGDDDVGGRRAASRAVRPTAGARGRGARVRGRVRPRCDAGGRRAARRARGGGGRGTL